MAVRAAGDVRFHEEPCSTKVYQGRIFPFRSQTGINTHTLSSLGEELVTPDQRGCGSVLGGIAMNLFRTLCLVLFASKPHGCGNRCPGSRRIVGPDARPWERQYSTRLKRLCCRAAPIWIAERDHGDPTVFQAGSGPCSNWCKTVPVHGCEEFTQTGGVFEFGSAGGSLRQSLEEPGFEHACHRNGGG